MIKDPYKHLPKDIQKTSALLLYQKLVTPRLIEEKMLRLIRQGRITKWFSGYGQEAIAVGAVLGLTPDDVVLPMHRNLGVFTTRGIALKPLFCQLMGKEGGFTNGRDRTFHFGKLDHRIVGMISHLAAMLPVACGFGLATKLEGSQKVALAFVGEGATREGDFHEALSLAAAWKLPVIFVIENNGYGLSTPTQEVIPVENLADAALGYGMPGHSVDGNDLMAVISAIENAAKTARAGGGPTLLEMKTFRMRGHEEASGVKYVPPHLFEEWSQKDPIQRFKKQILEIKGLSETDLKEIEDHLLAEIEVAVRFALDQPEVKSTLEKELTDVYAPSPTRPIMELPPDAPEKRFIDGVTDALRLAMQKDEKVLLMGQDIAGYGGVFKVTEGFAKEFGLERVRNTPIMESGVLGAALGLALEGFKPVVEMQYADFISCGFNQIVNNLATTHYRWGAPVNVTIRAPFGGYIGAGPFHSQSPEAWFCHVPGLKVVVPATPADAKGLLMAAIVEPNPVLVFEHKFLYRNEKGPLPDGDYFTPIGKARILHVGDAATLVTWGLGTRWAVEEAAFWAKEGKLVEVIDLRTLVPWDREAVLASVRKTNRLLVLHEAHGTGGFGAEITSEVIETAFEHLDAPPKRVTGANFPIAFSTQIEQEVYAAKARLRQSLNNLLAY